MLVLAATVFVLLLVSIFMPKTLTPAEYYFTTLFAFIFNVTTDLIVNLQWNLYTYFHIGIDFGEYLIIYVIGPCTNIIFLNYYPQKRGFPLKAAYILGWSLFSIFYEVFIGLPSGMIVYYHWKWWYSALAYPPIFIALAVHWRLMRKLLGVAM